MNSYTEYLFSCPLQLLGFQCLAKEHFSSVDDGRQIQIKSLCQSSVTYATQFYILCEIRINHSKFSNESKKNKRPRKNAITTMAVRKFSLIKPQH